MSVFDQLLRQFAIDNVWGSPSKESLYVIKPARLSRMRGAMVTQRVKWEDIYLPTNRDTYHVFQIGKIAPSLLGIHCLNKNWVSLKDLINSSFIIAEVYDNNGLMYPKMNCYLRMDASGDITLAVKKTRQLTTIDSEEIFFRVYTNSFYFSKRNTFGNEATECISFVSTGENTAIEANYVYAQYREKPGYAYGYRNGAYVSNFNPNLTRNGDILEIFYDASVYRVIDFDLSKLKSFTSTIDDKHKYLLHYPQSDNKTIDFVNNIDIYLVRKQGAYGRGYYYNKHHPDSIRMLSHKDYSVPVSYISGLYHNHSSEWGMMNDLTIRMIIRRGGFDRPLIKESNRIFELYKMEDSKVRSALLGVDAVVDNWKADQLESSPYPRIMLNKSGVFDISDIQNMLGYDSIAKNYGDTPIKTTKTVGRPEVILPPLLTKDVTVYEFNKKGLLLGFYYHGHDDNEHYRCYNQDTYYVEVIVGRGGNTIDAIYGEFEITPDPLLNYRSYICDYYNAKPTYRWLDVSNNGVTIPENGKLKIIADDIYWYPAFVSDKTFLSYSLKLTPHNGVYQFNVRDRRRVDNDLVWMDTTIPTRRLDVWLNGRWLVRDVDFFVKWPKVVITNKEFLKDAPEQDIVLRATGFCKEDMTLEEPREVGFVVNGYLSANNRYDTRDDKVLSYYVDGYIRDKGDLHFAENVTEAQVDNARNGAPYEVKETIIAFRDMSYLDTYMMRDESRSIDKKIEDYKTLMSPQKELPNPNFIKHRWKISSPFMQRIYSALLTRQIPFSAISGQYSDQKIHELVKPYLEYLELDPVKKGVHLGYVEVHAHGYKDIIDMSIYHYNFLARVNKLYMDSQINLSQQVKVIIPNEEGFS